MNETKQIVLIEESGRIEREKKTVAAMVRIYCCAHGHARAKGEALCAECATLLDYSHRRLTACAYGDAKPTCKICPVHCYKPVMRERMKEVMRFAGPRMMWRHPILAMRHLLDERKAGGEGAEVPLPPGIKPPGK